MRNVKMVADKQLKAMLASGQSQLGLGLPEPEMPVPFVSRDGGRKGWDLGVDQQMVVACT